MRGGREGEVGVTMDKEKGARNKRKGGTGWWGTWGKR